VTRLGYGNAEGKSGGDAVKEIIGDALRNAAMRFGAALDLWHKGDLHADEDRRQPASARAELAINHLRAAPSTAHLQGGVGEEQGWLARRDGGPTPTPASSRR
jgi:hypothetical protein